MAGCCHDDDCAADAMAEGQARVLRIVLAINVVMFVVEFSAGWIAGSTALLGDSLDMLGDALVYGFSLVAVARGARWKAASAGLKGAIMAVFGAVVLLQAGARVLWGVPPASGLMAATGVLVLLANAVCLVVLTRHRGDDVNMSSAWACSRNDIVANVGVLAAAGAVALTASPWPDILVGTAVALLFLRSSVRVLGDARRSWDAAPAG